MKKFEIMQPSEDWLDGYSLGYKRGQMKLVKIMLEQVDATPKDADGYTDAVRLWLKQIEQTLKEYK
jgi:hypothetical protein